MSTTSKETQLPTGSKVPLVASLPVASLPVTSLPPSLAKLPNPSFRQEKAPLTLSSLQKREKVLVQYRLLKDFDELKKFPLPGIDVRVLEDNLYEWHITMCPLSGNYCRLTVTLLIVIFPNRITPKN